MATSLFWVGFPYLLMGFTHSYLMLLGCVALVGFGNSLWHPTAIPTLARRFPERKGLVLSLHGMGGNVGDAIAPIVVGTLLAVLSWREVVILNVVPGVVIALLIFVFLGTMQLGGKKREASSEAGAQSLRDYFRGLPELFRNRALILLSTSSAFRSMTQNAVLTFLPVYLAYEMGYSPFWVGACMFALQTAGFAAAPVAGHLSDRMGRKSVMMTSMAMTAVVLVFMALAAKSLAFVFFVAVLGFFLYAIRPVLQAWLLETTPKNMGGTSIGVLFGAQAVGSAVGRVLGGLGAGGPALSIPPERLVTGGPYRYCRNPMYLGHLIFLAGLAFALDSWLAAAVLVFHAAWFDRRVRDDEARLSALFGDPYRAYLARVKRWIPGLL